MGDSSSKDSRKPVNGGLQKLIIGFIGAVFTTVCLWIGSTVNVMSKEMAKLSTVLETQVKTTDGYARSLEALVTRISGVEIEQAKRSSRVYDIEQIRADSKFAKTQSERLQRLVEDLARDLEKLEERADGGK